MENRTLELPAHTSALQTLLNGSRLGFYEGIRTNVNKIFGFSPSQQVMPTSVLAGAASGAIGGVYNYGLWNSLLKQRQLHWAIPSSSSKHGCRQVYRLSSHYKSLIISRLIHLHFQSVLSITTSLLLMRYDPSSKQMALVV